MLLIGWVLVAGGVVATATILIASPDNIGVGTLIAVLVIAAGAVLTIMASAFAGDYLPLEVLREEERIRSEHDDGPRER